MRIDRGGGSGDRQEPVRQRQAYTEPVRQILTPNAEIFFAGKMDLARLSLVDRLIAKMVNAKDEDLRDWNKIRAWGEALEPVLRKETISSLPPAADS